MGIFNALTAPFGKSKKGDDNDNKKNSGIGKLAALDALLKAVAGHFLYHVPQEKIRGPQWLWGLIIAVAGTVGPLAFLTVGLKWDDKPWKDALPSERSK